MPDLRFAGRLVIDHETTRQAFYEAEKNAQVRNLRALCADPDNPEPDVAALIDQIDQFVSKDACDAEADQQIAQWEQGAEPFRADIENPDILDPEVEIRLFASTEHPGNPRRDFTGDWVEIRRTDTPDQAPLRLPRHLPQPPEDFWPQVIKQARKLNR